MLKTRGLRWLVVLVLVLIAFSAAGQAQPPTYFGFVVYVEPGSDGKSGRARVASVTEGGPASIAGLATGDYLTAIDGKALVVSNDHELFRALENLGVPGQPIGFSIERDHQKLEKSIVPIAATAEQIRVLGEYQTRLERCANGGENCGCQGAEAPDLEPLAQLTAASLRLSQEIEVEVAKDAGGLLSFTTRPSLPVAGLESDRQWRMLIDPWAAKLDSGQAMKVGIRAGAPEQGHGPRVRLLTHPRLRPINPG